VGLVCLLLLNCGIPMKTKTYIYPHPIEFLFNQMISVLRQLDFEILTVDKIDRTITADRTEARAYQKFTIGFTEQNEATTVQVLVQFAGKADGDESGWCDQIANEIMQKFEDVIYNSPNIILSVKLEKLSGIERRENKTNSWGR